MGDVLTLIEEGPGQDQRRGRQRTLLKMTRNQFYARRFSQPVGQFKKLGRCRSLMKMLPNR
jgi:signal recognition particle GTPase